MADWPATVALPGVISADTLATEDLIQRFSSVLKEISPTTARFVAHKFGYGTRHQLLDEIIESLEQLAPEGYYFGTHPGDGACFGFFEHGHEPDEDTPEVRS